MPAPVNKSTFKKDVDSALGVKSVSKSTICTWYAALFYIFLVIYLVQIVGIVAALPNASAAWILVPLLIADVVVLANLYFYIAMCEKLPEHAIDVAITVARGQPMPPTPTH